MNTKHFLFVFCIIFLGCEKEKIIEVPDNVSKIADFEILADSLKSLIPESGNILITNPNLFSDIIQKNLVLIKESNVFVTFIDDCTSNRNSLCWYAYDISQPVSKASDLKWDILFPNISKLGEGGKLELGYSLQLGKNKFPAGTVIGFLLIVDGWEDGYIDLNRRFFYTNVDLNIGAVQQHVLFKMAYSKHIIIGFEDGYFNDLENCDRDFNDIIFAVSDNKEGKEATSFDLTKIIIK